MDRASAQPGHATLASFQEEAIPYLDAVYRFALRLTGSEDEAEDLVQETFMKAYNAWEQYTPGTKCKSWLFTIARNRFLRTRGREERLDAIVTRETGAGVQESEAAPIWRATAGVDPEGAFFASIVDQTILEAIDALPDDYRLALVLSDVEGLSYGEIADMTDVPVGTVKSRLFRARRRLQETLHGYAVDMGYISAPPKADAGTT